MWPFRVVEVERIVTVLPGETKWICGAPLPEVWAYQITEYNGLTRNMETIGYTRDFEFVQQLLEDSSFELRARLLKVYEMPDGSLCATQPVTKLKVLS